MAEVVGVGDGPGVGLEPTALELAEHGDRARAILDQAGAGLLVRLHNRSDDLVATKALQAVNSASARLVSHIDPCERDRLVQQAVRGRTHANLAADQKQEPASTRGRGRTSKPHPAMLSSPAG